MNPEIKQRWLDALKSGKYKRGTTRLKVVPVDDDEPVRYCCLGVLCDLYVKDHPDTTKWWCNSLEFMDENGVSHVEEHYLPGVVREWAGIDHWSPKADCHVLADVNDRAPEIDDSFNCVIPLIEKGM